MKELSLHILDIAQNSVVAQSTALSITVEEQADGLLTLTIGDNGNGMSPELLATVCDPFSTTRTTRKVGMGVALLQMLARQTGGDVHLESAVGVGTTVTATFYTNHIDCLPVGDLGETVATLIQGASHLQFTYQHKTPKGEATLSTDELKEALGEDVPLSAPEVVLWIRDYMREQEALL